MGYKSGAELVKYCGVCLMFHREGEHKKRQ